MIFAMTKSFILFSFLISFTAFTQKLVSVKGKAQLKVERNVTQEQTEQKALELAMVNGIESEFGTYVEQQSDIYIDNQRTDVRTIGQTKVKGEWVETIGKPVYTYDTRTSSKNAPEVWITCEIKGNVKEIKKNPAPFEAYTLKTFDLTTKTIDFQQNDMFYLWFKSAIKGYITVFMLYNEQASRLLPYQDMGEKYINNIPIAADQDYLFFSKEKNKLNFKDVPDYKVDEMKLITSETLEKDMVYVIFSPTPFNKPLLEQGSASTGNYTVPALLSEEKFNRWLEDNRIHNPDFDYKIIPITIKGK
jgi:hypothetical protein